MNIKAVLFDADGVLTLPEEFFSQVYARSRGLDTAPFDRFFKEDFPAARIGKADLKQLIEANPELWKWEGTTDELLQLWFETEDVRNEPLIQLAQAIRAKGIPCYVATNQEKYRGQHIKDVMFKDEFDGYFISAEMGAEKPNQDFFEVVISTLQLQPQEIAFFDDSKPNIDAALELGIQAVQYHGLDDAKQFLSML